MRDELLKSILNRGRLICGTETLSVSSTVVGLTNIPAKAVGAVCTVESSVTGASEIIVRYLEDGTTPTDTIGMPCKHFNVFTISSAENLKKFKAIQAQAGTHQITVNYLK